MQFLNSLFGGEDGLWLSALFALGIVIVLIVLGMWLLKLLTGATSKVGRGRNRRLTLVDSLPVDQRRRLLIVRRDNVEHVILTGGPADVLVETGIPADDTRAAAQRRPQNAEAAPRPAARPRPVPDIAPEPANVSPIDRLRDLGKPVGQRRAPPRHPGLMRPVSQMERPALGPDAQISSNGRRDSAKDSGIEDGQAEFGDRDGRGQAGGWAAERN